MTRESLFPDADLVNFTMEMYGPVMGCRVEEIFADDPNNENGFSQSVRRSLTRELDLLIQQGKYNEAMRDV